MLEVQGCATQASSAVQEKGVTALITTADSRLLFSLMDRELEVNERNHHPEAQEGPQWLPMSVSCSIGPHWQFQATRKAILNHPYLWF